MTEKKMDRTINNTSMKYGTKDKETISVPMLPSSYPLCLKLKKGVFDE